MEPEGNIIEKRDRKSNSFRFRLKLAKVSKRNRKVKIEIQAKKATESTTYVSRSQLCTHAGNLALGNTDTPQKQPNATAIRFWDVVGPPMEVMVRPTLTPRD